MWKKSLIVDKIKHITLLLLPKIGNITITKYKTYKITRTHELFTVHCGELAAAVELGCVLLDCSGVVSLF